jgi:DNA-binding NtrC family response regulator
MKRLPIPMSRYRILVVDDDPAIRFGVVDFLGSRGFEIDEASTLAEARRLLVQTRPDAMILDNVLPDGVAVHAIGELLELDPGVAILVLTAHGSIDLAVEAIKSGAEQFLTKPIEMAALEDVLERCLDNRRLRRKQAAAREQSSRQEIDPFLGGGDAIRRLREAAHQALATESPVLIQGETGTGKGVLAHWLHANGSRREEAFVDLNCAGLSRELLDSELFGHVRGAFTGAVQDKPGLLELAHRGELFLDEVGDMDPAIQSKVLKVLEEQTYRRLGDVKQSRVDVKLIAATHRDLAAMQRQGGFRADLYYRISTIPLRVPPLRERPEDLPLLAESLLGRLAADLKREPVTLSPAAVERLREHSWPGNIRELRNVLERAVLAVRGGELEPHRFHFDPVHTAAPTSGGASTLDEMEAEQIRHALTEERGQVAAAAERLGIPRSTFYVKLKDHRIDPGDYRP